MNGKKAKELRSLYKSILLDSQNRPKHAPLRNKKTGNFINPRREMKRIFTRVGGGPKGIEAATAYAHQILVDFPIVSKT